MSNLVIIVRPEIIKPGKILIQVCQTAIGFINRIQGGSVNRVFIYKVSDKGELDNWKHWAIKQNKPWYLREDLRDTQIPTDTSLALAVGKLTVKDCEAFRSLKEIVF